MLSDFTPLRSPIHICSLTAMTCGLYFSLSILKCWSGTSLFMSFINPKVRSASATAA